MQWLTAMHVQLFVLLRVCEGARVRQCWCGGWGGVVVVIAGCDCMGGTRGSGVGV